MAHVVPPRSSDKTFGMLSIQKKLIVVVYCERTQECDGLESGHAGCVMSAVHEVVKSGFL